MHLLILTLLLAVGGCEAVWQTLTCPYEPEQESLPRVWCRQSSSDCCSGLSFSQDEHSVDGGKVMVTQGPDSFTVAVVEPSHGQGVYWCGLLSKNNTVIKLAEAYFHSSSGAYVWSICRWMVLPLLPTVTIFTSIYFRTTTHTLKKEEEPYDYDDIAMSRALADPQYERTKPLSLSWKDDGEQC